MFFYLFVLSYDNSGIYLWRMVQDVMYGIGYLTFQKAYYYRKSPLLSEITIIVDSFSPLFLLFI